MSIVFAQKNLTDDTTDAFDSFVSILLAGLDTVAVQLDGTFTGTVQFEVTTDGDTWGSLAVTPSGGGAAVTSATGAGIWATDGCAGFYAARVRCSTFGSGVISASIGAGANSVAAVASAADGQVLFMSGTAPIGDSGLTYDSGTGTVTATAVATTTLSAGATTLTGTLTAVDVVVGTGKAIKTDTTTAHTALLQAYDVDGAAYKTFATLTNANSPSLNISQPSGGILAIVPPSADPHVVGAIWNNSGTLAISAG